MGKTSASGARLADSGVDAVVFDLDGVVTLTASLHAKAWKQAFDAFLKERATSTEEKFVPFDVDGDYLQYVDGKPRIEGVKSFLASRGIELPEGNPDDGPQHGTAWGLGNRKNQIFHELLDREGAEVDEHTVGFIRALADQGVSVAVASSSKNCERILKSVGLIDLFEARVDGVVSEALELEGKPAPDIFLEAARRLGAEARNSAVVEDAVAGVQAGQAGGFGLVIGFDRGGAAVSLRENGADWVVDGFDEDSPVMLGEWFRRRSERKPSILRAWSDVAEEIADKKVVVFLDYDGTLTPIVDRPEMAVLSDSMRETLVQLSHEFPVAIISGRDRADVQNLVQVEGVAYAGSHGFDIVGPDGKESGHTVADWIEPRMKQVAARARREVGKIPGVVVEEKRFSVAVHYRLVSDEDRGEVESVVDRIVRDDDRLRKAGGKKVFEIRPNVDWDKGKALEFLLSTFDLKGDRVVPFYAGDDETDEDAFRVLDSTGIGILVSESPRPTRARYWAQAPWEVEAFLRRLGRRR